MIQKHIHKLKRHKYKTGNEIFFCILPDCNFKIEAPLALGKRTLCNLCDAEMMLDKYTLKLNEPTCANCRKHKITGPDGKKHYIRRNVLPVIATIAEDATDNLKSRLSMVVGEIDDDVL